jgi:hypothetical protein
VLQERGGDAFTEFSLPEAILKLAKEWPSQKYSTMSCNYRFVHNIHINLTLNLEPADGFEPTTC